LAVAVEHGDVLIGALLAMYLDIMLEINVSHGLIDIETNFLYAGVHILLNIQITVTCSPIYFAAYENLEALHGLT
jgi:hypothetical protein